MTALLRPVVVIGEIGAFLIAAVFGFAAWRNPDLRLAFIVEVVIYAIGLTRVLRSGSRARLPKALPSGFSEQHVREMLDALPAKKVRLLSSLVAAALFVPACALIAEGVFGASFFAIAVTSGAVIAFYASAYVIGALRRSKLSR